jgi:hypothetical protein
MALATNKPSADLQVGNSETPQKFRAYRELGMRIVRLALRRKLRKRKLRKSERASVSNWESLRYTKRLLSV